MDRSGTPPAWPWTSPVTSIVAEANEQRVQVIEPSGVVATVAGTGKAGDGGDGGVATAGQLDEPTGVAVDRSGDVFIADTANCKVRVVAAADGKYPRPAGPARPPLHRRRHRGLRQCGPGRAAGGAQLFDPVAVAVDFAGDLLVADQGDQSVLLATEQRRHLLRHRGRRRGHRRGCGRDRELRAVRRRRALGHQRRGRAQRPSWHRPRADRCARAERRLHARDPDRPGPIGDPVRPGDDGGDLYTVAGALPGARQPPAPATERAGC